MTDNVALNCREGRLRTKVGVALQEVGDVTHTLPAYDQTGRVVCRRWWQHEQNGRRIGGIQPGNPSEVFFHDVTLNIGGWDYKTRIGFSYDIATHGYGVLGQKGFFDKFFIGFNFSKEEIELKEIRRT